jgi:hypothetical protein
VNSSDFAVEEPQVEKPAVVVMREFEINIDKEFKDQG